jgi:hypothetical protein
MSCADGVTYQPGMSTYRVTVMETQRREITLLRGIRPTRSTT